MKWLLLLLTFAIWTQALAQEPQPISGINMKKNSKWPSQSNGKVVIDVSWENGNASNREERQWVKEAIETSWEKYANIDFIGWGNATTSSRGIRIIIDDSGWPHTKGLGTQLDGMPSGMLLTFKFLGQFRCVRFSKEDCIKFIAVHEFGHALGLAHEQNRLDCLCNEKPQGGDGDFYVTPCDLESVMNYCNPKWTNHGKLSQLDIEGIQKIYGRSGSTSTTVDLDEIKLIPCTNGAIGKLRDIRNLVNNTPAFKIGVFTEETRSVPQKVIDGLASNITIRFFHPDDEAKANDIKKILTAKGFKAGTISIENMLPRMTKTYPNYIEIWSKDTLVSNSSFVLDEIRLVPADSTKIDSVKLIKAIITSSNAFQVNTYSQEDKSVTQKAVGQLPNIVTVRYFHPDDETKAREIKKLLEANGFDARLISVENMISRMSKTYPNYIEIWQK